MKFNRTLLSAVMVVTCSSMVACVTHTRDDDFAGKKNHLSQKVMIDANRDTRSPVVNQVQGNSLTDSLPARIDLAEALSILDEDAWNPVSYPIDNAYDKGNPESPFHDKREFRTFYHPPFYEGVDSWVLEKGADVNASIEYWLAIDAIDLVHQNKIFHDKDQYRIGGSRPLKNYYGRTIRPERPTYADTPKELEFLLADLLAYGVDRKTAMVVSHLCLGSSFKNTMREYETEYFKVNEENLINYSSFFETPYSIEKKQKAINDYYLGYTGPLQGGDDESCDELRTKITKDEKSPFWGDYLLTKSPEQHKNKLPNQVMTTLRIDEPKLDVGLWQHLMSKDLYKGLGRVREEGLFAGLLYPERAKVVIISSTRARNGVGVNRFRWDRYFDSHSPYDDAGRAAYLMSDTMFSWYFDNQSAQSHAYRRKLTGGYGNYIDRNGVEKHAFAGCTLDPTLVSYQGNNTREFRKFYQCQLGRSLGYGLYSGLRTQFQHNAANRIDPTHEYQAVFEFTSLTTDLRVKSSCDNAEFKGLCENNKQQLLQEEIDYKQSKSFFTFEDALAYTQISESGLIEGVVLVAGFKVIYNLTDIAKWYKTYNPHKRDEWTNYKDRFEVGNSLAYKDDRYQSSNSHDGVSIALQE